MSCNHKWNTIGRCTHCDAIEPVAAEYRAKREARGLTQDDVAEILLVSRNTVNRHENGKVPMHRQTRKMLDLYYENLVLRELAAEKHSDLTFA